MPFNLDPKGKPVPFHPEAWDKQEKCVIAIDYASQEFRHTNGIPYLGIYHPKTHELYHWWNSPTHMTITGDWFLYHNYGLASELTDEIEDQIYIHWTLQFRKQSTRSAKFYWDDNTQREGFITPAGEWYPCGYGEHSSLAKILYIFKHEKVLTEYPYDYETALYQDGYVRIGTNFPSVPEHVQMTKEQDAALREIIDAGRSRIKLIEKWNEGAKFVLEDFGATKEKEE